MNHRKLETVLFIIFILFTFQTVNAQWSAHSSFNREYNTNPFYLPEDEPSWISTAEFGLGNSFKHVNLYYTGDYIIFDDLSDRNFYWHQFLLSGEIGRHIWGISAEQRINKTVDNLYDYDQWKGYASFNQIISKIFLNLNFQVSYINFPNMVEMNNWNYTLNFKGVKSFPTRTTILSGVNLNYKKYVNMYILPDTSTLSVDEILYSVDGGIFGGGGGNGGGGHGGGGGNLIGTEAETPSNSTLKYWVRLSQGLFSKTGVAVQYDHQMILSGTNRGLVGDVLNYQLENLLFDDPSNYESNRVGFQFTRIFPKDFSCKANYNVTSKSYPSQGIYTDAEEYDETTNRSDDNQYATFSLTKSMNGFIGKNSGINLSLEFTYLKNKSNSYWYNYTNQLTSMSISFIF